MYDRTWKGVVTTVAAVALLGLCGCQGAPLSPTTSTMPAPTSIADAPNGDWTTDAPPGTRLSYSNISAPTASLQGAPVSEVTPVAFYPDRCPPPPPPPGGLGVGTLTTPEPCVPVTYAPDPCDPCAAPPVAPVREWSGCGLPCAEGISQWHVRGVGGVALFEGTDPPETCTQGYYGADIGRTFCGCWGIDAFYRMHCARFERDHPPPPPPAIGKDGGYFHHVGLKLTYESSFGASRWYWWGGVGAEYFWTTDFIDDDDGFGAYGEAGLGYVLSRNIRVRVGVNVHGLDTHVGRKSPANDGTSRWLWIFSPVGEVEFSW